MFEALHRKVRRGHAQEKFGARSGMLWDAGRSASVFWTGTQGKTRRVTSQVLQSVATLVVHAVSWHCWRLLLPGSAAQDLAASGEVPTVCADLEADSELWTRRLGRAGSGDAEAAPPQPGHSLYRRLLGVSWRASE